MRCIYLAQTQGRNANRQNQKADGCVLRAHTQHECSPFIVCIPRDVFLKAFLSTDAEEEHEVGTAMMSHDRANPIKTLDSM